jgi:uncharacterized protein YqgC (DUF456 family)
VDLTDTQALVTFVAGAAIVIGVIGVVLPGVPGLVLCWAGVLVWAVFGAGGWPKWLILAAATGVTALGLVVKWLWPARNLRRIGVPNRSLLAGGVLGLVGFFAVPVVGLIGGFVLGIWLAERARLGDARPAWSSTVEAVKAAGLALLVELSAGLGVAVLWVLGLAIA